MNGCASPGCPGDVVITAYGIGLCDSHRRKLRGALGQLPQARFTDPGKPWFVYYIAWPHLPGLVKIGATADLTGRLWSHKRDGHLPQVLAVEPGYGELETERHAQFEDLRTERLPELFRRAPELEAHIDRLATEHAGWRSWLRYVPWWLNPDNKAATFAEAPRCGAKTVGYGNPCQHPAGNATPHPGRGRCHLHDIPDDGTLPFPGGIPGTIYATGRRRLKSAS